MKKDSENQLFFDFDAPAESPVAEVVETVAVPVPEAAAARTVEIPPAEAPQAAPAAAEQAPKAVENSHALHQAVFAQLVKNGAAGAALHVPCRKQKFKASVAAYFTDSRKYLNELQSCVLVDIYSRRNQCIPECAGSQAVAAELAGLRKKRSAMEEQIKLDEPELRVEDELFDEFRSFDFARSTNKEYHQLCRRINSLQQSLYKGTRMEQLARSAVADYLIIAVPENVISEDELPDNWGLWYISEELKVREIKAPTKQNCTPESRLHMLQNIGRCALNNVLFANGVRINADKSVRFTRIPRARRK